jgi:hypothetical protein
MFFDYDKYTYYVTAGGTDMRKGADSLAMSVYCPQISLTAHSSLFDFTFANNGSHYPAAIGESDVYF